PRKNIVKTGFNPFETTKMLLRAIGSLHYASPNSRGRLCRWHSPLSKFIYNRAKARLYKIESSRWLFIRILMRLPCPGKKASP
ncbi:hypothetical protein, partial [Parafilimonas sp.]|uniref:hypothetical protein n=1 Tax=Parafilimonas sp. TaxID=1969739 RepID=UPI0039E3D425